MPKNPHSDRSSRSSIKEQKPRNSFFEKIAIRTVNFASGKNLHDNNRNTLYKYREDKWRESFTVVGGVFAYQPEPNCHLTRDRTFTKAVTGQKSLLPSRK